MIAVSVVAHSSSDSVIARQFRTESRTARARRPRRSAPARGRALLERTAWTGSSLTSASQRMARSEIAAPRGWSRRTARWTGCACPTTTIKSCSARWSTPIEAGTGGSGRRSGCSAASVTTRGRASWSRAGSRPAFHLELTDAMAWPENDRPSGVRDAHAVIRRLRCVRGEVACACDLDPRLMFEPLPALDASALIQPLSVWTSRPIPQDGARVLGQFVLREGEEMWGVLASGCDETWTRERAGEAARRGGRLLERLGRQAELHRAARAGRDALARSRCTCSATPATARSSRRRRRRCPSGSAARGTRITGCRVGARQLDRARDHDPARRRRDRRALHGLARERRRRSPCADAAALQARRLARGQPREPPELYGYRGSRPVRLGNHAWKQHQFGSLGFLAECVYRYRVHGGKWKPAHWELIASAANTAAQHWRNPTTGYGS